jgi:hypothetical protein
MVFLYGLYSRGSITGRDRRLCWLWYPSSLLSNGDGRQSDRRVTLIAFLHLVPWLGIRGAWPSCGVCSYCPGATPHLFDWALVFIMNTKNKIVSRNMACKLMKPERELRDHHHQDWSKPRVLLLLLLLLLLLVGWDWPIVPSQVDPEESYLVGYNAL